MTHLQKIHFSAAFLFKGNGAQAQTNKPTNYRILRADMFTVGIPGIPGECMHPLIIIGNQHQLRSFTQALCSRKTCLVHSDTWVL